jgi:uncharacterized protein DUF3455
MFTTVIHRLARSGFMIGAAVLVAACVGEAPLAPARGPDLPPALSQSSATARVDAATGQDDQATANRAVDLGACQKLQVEAGSKLVFHAYANGVQIYRWSGTSWSLVGPSAVLSADAHGASVVGIHYAGPTWESVSGAKVVAAVIDRCTSAPNAIPWLLLGAVSADGPGIFHRVAFIQRVNTAGGTAPSSPGTQVGQEARIPYTAEYFFYRAP